MASDFEIIENSMKAQNKFGHRYGSETLLMSREDIQALLDGKQLAAVTGGDEYSLFIILDDEEDGWIKMNSADQHIPNLY